MVRNGTNGKGNGRHAVGSDGRLLTVSQVADRLSVHSSSVRRWANMGLLPSYRLGVRGARRFKPEEVSEFLASHQGVSPAS